MRHKRIRGKIKGTSTQPRLCVFRSLKKLYAQVIDDDKGHTLLSASGRSPEQIGEEIAKKCAKRKIKMVVFDRNGYKYHGKIKTLADTARKQGLKF